MSALIALSPVETLDFGLRRSLITPSQYDSLVAELMSNPTARSNDLCDTMALISTDSELRKRIQTAVGMGNQHLAQVEKVKRFIILDRDFSQEAQELTQP